MGFWGRRWRFRYCGFRDGGLEKLRVFFWCSRRYYLDVVTGEK